MAERLRAMAPEAYEDSADLANVRRLSVAVNKLRFVCM